MALTKLNFGGNQQALVAANIPTLTSSKMPAGSVLQVIMAEKTNAQQITANSTYQDVTGLTLNITPISTSNKVFITVQFRWGNNSSVNNRIRIMRNSTEVQFIDLGNIYYNFSSPNRPYMDSANSHLDSPSTTSQITYKIQAYTSGGHFTFNGRGGETNDEKRCQLVAMEIAG